MQITGAYLILYPFIQISLNVFDENNRALATTAIAATAAAAAAAAAADVSISGGDKPVGAAIDLDQRRLLHTRQSHDTHSDTFILNAAINTQAAQLQPQRQLFKSNHLGNRSDGVHTASEE